MNSRNYQIRLLTEDDIAAALLLCRDSGWNQLHSDWLRLIRYQPDGCFAATIAGELVGTITTTSYGTELAWIGMMLVDRQHRRCGIATELMRYGMEYLRDNSVACIKLDATPLGKHVYERLGFRVELTFHRWAGELAGSAQHESDPLCGDDYHLDQQAFGTDRRELLSAFAADSIVASRADGFGMQRPGYLATYLGPVVASSADSARKIIYHLMNTVSGDIFWDTLDDNPDAVTLVRSIGLQPVRELSRMYLGDDHQRANVSLQYAIAGPAVG